MIPRIIHQTWKDTNIPEHLHCFVRSWQQHHPDWDFILWTDKMNRDFISQNYAAFLPVYDGYHTAIQRVDAVRYFILLKMGGVFIDLDFECLKNIGPLLESTTFAAGLEPREHARAHRKEYIISNAFMAGCKDASFLKCICNTIARNDYRQYAKEAGFNAVLDCAGPFMLSRIYKDFEPKGSIRILEPALLYPLVKNEITGRVAAAKEIDAAVIKQAYAMHHYWGSWWH